MTKRIVGCMALCGFLMAVSVQAHHSLAGVYDMKHNDVPGSTARVS